MYKSRENVIKCCFPTEAKAREMRRHGRSSVIVCEEWMSLVGTLLVVENNTILY